MTNLNRKHDYLITSVDLKKLDRILKRIHDEYKKGNITIEIDIPRTSIAFKNLVMDRFLDELQLSEDDFIESSEDVPYSKEEYISEMKTTLLEIVKRIRMNFNDFRDRQLGLFQLKETLESVRKDFRGDQFFLEVIICLFDAVKNTYAENLSIEQVDVLGTVISEIESELTESNADNITERLISAGFNPLPKLDGLAEIYERQGEI